MSNVVIPKDEQARILHEITNFTSDLHHRWCMVKGASLALGERTPPHWTINLECGRVDRLFSVKML